VLTLQQREIRQLLPGAVASAVHKHIQDGKGREEGFSLLRVGGQAGLDKLQGHAIPRKRLLRIQGLAAEDSDGYLVDNWTELLTGTDPHDPASVLAIQEEGAGFIPEGFSIQWLGREGHAYRIAGCRDLAAGSWAVVGGPWTNWDNLPMQWTQPDTVTDRYYRVEEFRP